MFKYTFFYLFLFIFSISNTNSVSVVSSTIGWFVDYKYIYNRYTYSIYFFYFRMWIRDRGKQWILSIFIFFLLRPVQGIDFIKVVVFADWKKRPRLLKISKCMLSLDSMISKKAGLCTLTVTSIITYN